MENTANQRLKIFRQSLKKTQSEFAEVVNLKQGSYSDVERGKVKVSGDIKNALNKEFSLNIDWLESGTGDMHVKQGRLEATPLHLASDPNDYDNDGTRFEALADGTLRMRVAIIPSKAFAGYLRGFQDPEFYEDLDHISIDVYRQHSGHYLAFEVKGESMTTLEPEHFRESIFDGSIAIGRDLSRHQWRYKLHIHNYSAWVIVHKTEGILIKQIIAHDVDRGVITIHSLNPNKNEFPDEDLFLDDIEQIFNVVQVVNKRS